MKETTSIFDKMGSYEREIFTEIFSGRAKMEEDGKLTPEIAAEIEKLFHEYKKNEVEVGDYIITLEAGNFGNMCIRSVDELRKPTTLKYLERGDYEYVSILTNKEETILWTDFSETQPFNRQAPFYVGHDWSRLNLIKTTPTYREFDVTPHPSNVSFGVYGFYFNPYWFKVQFGICLKAEDKDAFISKLRYFLGKP